ncbi:TetR family transcriptional regulator [Streptomyces sp. NPDC018031]|uniref:TetR/AcrR family transcriptional regulator n=1 Tax=Streptomyces sp. NPDC018031 TaxID=3365033 RepID=UPI0037B8B733
MTQAPSAPRRSDATRAAILQAARESFAAEGYERATIRTIARAVGIDPSMVMRYYGSKERLFIAASDTDLHLPDLGAIPAQEVGEVLVAHFLDRWEGDDVLTALLRVGVTHQAGAERMHEIVRRQLVPVVTAVCPDPADVPRRAALVTSQILGLALARFVLRFPPAVEMTREELIAWVAPTVQRYLTAAAP